MDPLTDVLESIRLTSGVFRRTELNAPWVVSTGALPVGVYHAVHQGSVWITVDNAEPLLVEAGQITVLPHGSGHSLSHDRRATGPQLEATVDPDRNVQLLTNDGDGPRASVLCGTFEFARSSVHPLLGMLPDLIVVPTDQAWLHGAVEALDAEIDNNLPGTEVMINRLSDIVLVSALRNYWMTLPDEEVGWLAGLRDPEIRHAIGLIHRWPERRWTAQSLAAEIGLSRATFFQRFTRLVGEPPAQYLTRWRIHRAAQLLEDGRSVIEITEAVGYNSTQAFTRAFKRFSGTTPGAYARSGHSGELVGAIVAS
ncbi:MAG: AraC family transcriptional regulator [Actinomycetia bacterium]|nr:AraC family transcriptional regulator [Actinomycetes bacterium]MCP4224975.1 AraC family transcriptional regulator [Actinomycetes bacterium]MCP5031098.1 AraC family transcriptional regulator [Actinomycetes bacterium]